MHSHTLADEGASQDGGKMSSFLAPAQIRSLSDTGSDWQLPRQAGRWRAPTRADNPPAFFFSCTRSVICCCVASSSFITSRRISAVKSAFGKVQCSAVQRVVLCFVASRCDVMCCLGLCWMAHTRTPRHAHAAVVRSFASASDPLTPSLTVTPVYTHLLVPSLPTFKHTRKHTYAQHLRTHARRYRHTNTDTHMPARTHLRIDN